MSSEALMQLSSDNDLVVMFEEAFRKQPTNEDLGVQTFFANVRASNWKSAHQASCQDATFTVTLMCALLGWRSDVQAISGGPLFVLGYY